MKKKKIDFRKLNEVHGQKCFVEFIYFVKKNYDKIWKKKSFFIIILINEILKMK